MKIWDNLVYEPAQPPVGRTGISFPQATFQRQSLRPIFGQKPQLPACQSIHPSGFLIQLTEASSGIQRVQLEKRKQLTSSLDSVQLANLHCSDLMHAIRPKRSHPWMDCLLSIVVWWLPKDFQGTFRRLKPYPPIPPRQICKQTWSFLSKSQEDWVFAWSCVARASPKHLPTPLSEECIMKPNGAWSGDGVCSIGSEKHGESTNG